MKKLFVVIMIITGIFLNVSGQPVTVMTYNIRYDNPNDGMNKWDLRKEYLANQIKFYEPDFLGTQEALHHQLTYVDSMLTEYSYIGVGRNEGKLEGEFSAIFYNSIKYNLLESSTFWLSETPSVPSKGWDASLNRICTYGLFEIKNSGNKIWIFNTHFDHRGAEARKKSTRLIINKINELNKTNYPVVLMGDFNLQPNDEGIKYLSKILLDTKLAKNIVPFGPTGTFNGFKFNEPVKKRIDYIFVSKEKIAVKKYAVLSDSKECKYPSDHLPVYVKLLIANSEKE